MPLDIALTSVPTGMAKSCPGCIDPHRIPNPEVRVYEASSGATHWWASFWAAAARAWAAATVAALSWAAVAAATRCWARSARAWAARVCAARASAFTCCISVCSASRSADWARAWAPVSAPMATAGVTAEVPRWAPVVVRTIVAAAAVGRMIPVPANRGTRRVAGGRCRPLRLSAEGTSSWATLSGWAAAISRDVSDLAAASGVDGARGAGASR